MCRNTNMRIPVCNFSRFLKRQGERERSKSFWIFLTVFFYLQHLHWWCWYLHLGTIMTLGEGMLDLLTRNRKSRHFLFIWRLWPNGMAKIIAQIFVQNGFAKFRLFSRQWQHATPSSVVVKTSGTKTKLFSVIFRAC